MNPLDLALYELFARKELSDGCYIKWEDMQGEHQITKYHSKVYEWQNMVSWKNTLTVISDNFEILWHEPQLHDVFRVAENKGWDIAISERELAVRNKIKRWWAVRLMVCPKQHLHCEYNPTLSLLSQTDETKQQLIDLFNK